jgi:hypothetical protein
MHLLSRNAKDHTAAFAEIAAAIGALSFHTLLLDGEVIVLDSHGVSRFQLLQRGTGKPIYTVFDCLYGLMEQRMPRFSKMEVTCGASHSLSGARHWSLCLERTSCFLPPGGSRRMVLLLIESRSAAVMRG